MALPSYYGAFSALTNYIMTSSTAHFAVESFGLGENDDYSVTGEDNYPRIFLELPIQTNYFTNRIEWTLALTVTDITAQDRSDEVEKLSNTWDIGNDLFEKFKADQAYILEDTYSNINVIEYGNDYTAGWRYEYVFKQAIPMNTCDILVLFTPPVIETEPAPTSYFINYETSGTPNQFLRIEIGGTTYEVVDEYGVLELENNFSTNFTTFLNGLGYTGFSITLSGVENLETGVVTWSLSITNWNYPDRLVDVVLNTGSFTFNHN